VSRTFAVADAKEISSIVCHEATWCSDFSTRPRGNESCRPGETTAELLENVTKHSRDFFTCSLNFARRVEFAVSLA
jgi:hypothetical protein